MPPRVSWIVSTVVTKDRNAHDSECSLRMKELKSGSTTSWPKAKSMRWETTSAHNALCKSSTRLPCLHYTTRKKSSALLRDKDRVKAKVNKARSKSFYRTTVSS